MVLAVYSLYIFGSVGIVVLSLVPFHMICMNHLRTHL